MSVDDRSSFVIPLFDIGDCDSCLFSWFCFPCAIAQSRTYLDGSPCLFNFFCLPAVPARWLIRSSYGIQGDSCNDCWTAVFCPCCNANQLYQTTKRFGSSTTDGGLAFNTGTWMNHYGSGTFQDCIYSFFCMPCSNGKILENSIGMPWYMGCCCVNTCTARNLIRYQYHIAGNDVVEECAIPYGLKCVGDVTQSCLPLIWLILYGVFVVNTMQQLKEVETRSSLNQSSSRYLFRDSTQPTPPTSLGMNPSAPVIYPATYVTTSQVEVFQPVRVNSFRAPSGYSRLQEENSQPTVNPVIGIPVHDKL